MESYRKWCILDHGESTYNWRTNCLSLVLTLYLLFSSEQLDADISLVRELGATNENPTTGAVSCAFSPAVAGTSPVCGIPSTALIAAEFANSNDAWTVRYKRKRVV